MATEPLIRIIAKTRGRLTECRSCGAPITWAKTFPNQKNHPLNGDPVALRTEYDAQQGTIDLIPSSESHFATCPDSQKWSRK